MGTGGDSLARKKKKNPGNPEALSRNSVWRIFSTDKENTSCRCRLSIGRLYTVDFPSTIGCHKAHVVTKRRAPEGRPCSLISIASQVWASRCLAASENIRDLVTRPLQLPAVSPPPRSRQVANSYQPCEKLAVGGPRAFFVAPRSRRYPSSNRSRFLSPTCSTRSIRTTVSRLLRYDLPRPRFIQGPSSDLI